MKQLITFILFLISITSFGQTIVVKPTDSLIVISPATYTIIPKAAVVTNPRNQPPTCFAGSSQTITLPINAVTLSGTASDKDGKIVSIVWSKATTLGSTIVSPNSLSTSVTGLAQGTHIFRLTVTDDSSATATASVNIIVNAPVVIDTSSIEGEGFGSQSIGGSQSSLLKLVSNKAEFDAAIGSNRTIKFTKDASFIDRVDLINISYLTIDGNGFNVTIDGNGNGDVISFDGANTHHCILRDIRVKNGGMDGINVIDGSHDILVTNCTSWGNKDGNIDIAGDSKGQTKNVTVQWCIIGGGVTSSYSGSTLVTGQSVSIHHNLYVPNFIGDIKGTVPVAERVPYIHSNYSPVGNPNCDFRNNVIYNWGRYASGIGYRATANFINNYYASNKSGAINPAADPSGNTGQYYVEGNVQLGGANINLNGGNHAIFNINPPYQVTTTDAKTAATIVLSKAGTAVKTPEEAAVIKSIVIQ